MPESNAMNPDQPITELFSKPDCPGCFATQRKLDQYRIPYIKHDVSVDENARDRVIALGYSGVPVVIRPDGESWHGYQPARIKGLLDD